MAGTLAAADSRKVLQFKWNQIFDVQEWIAFKPALGSYVYPCYSCKHLFSCKNAFLNHVNRRVILLKFTCTECDNMPMKFYNRCLFLLHCRKHYKMQKGQLNLKNLEVARLPLELYGVSRIPEIPYLFNVDEDLISDDGFMNSQFYIPNAEDKGNEIVTLRPTNLVIDRTTPNGDIQSLALKQVAKNIPKCQFITLQAYKEIQANMEALNQPAAVEVKTERPEEETISFRSWESAENGGGSTENGGGSIENGGGSIENGGGSIENGGGSTSISSSSGETDQLIISEPEPEPQEEANPLVLVKVEPVVDEPNMSLDNGRQSNSSIDHCPECKIPVPSLQNHFLGDNKPSELALRCGSCRLISPTMCSFRAHRRFHSQKPPHVCPDCGIQYELTSDLWAHMQSVCFHTAKSVRIKCPGRRCGKVFASEGTFGLHFKQTHVLSFFLCSTCENAFNALQECEEHCRSHENREKDFEKLYTCPGCTQDAMTMTEIKKHVDNHCTILCRYIYIYMCKFCKGYFRSHQTMSNHATHCKVYKPSRARSNPSTISTSKFASSKFVSGECRICFEKIIYPNSKPINYCKKCVPNPRQNSTSKTPCALCCGDFSDEEQHKKECKYAAPYILVERLDTDEIILEQIQNANANSSNTDANGNLPSKGRKTDSSPDEIRPRKRLRLIRPKKPEIVHDPTAEEAIQFNGIYHCHLCNYRDSLRVTFHIHIKNHRINKTDYQCMECGECFVVKPSLMKHLLHYHHIVHLDKYFLENDCFDEEAVNELAKVSKAPFLANNVEANQCKVCFEKFSSAEEHDKHFRTHGMAFLITNSI